MNSHHGVSDGNFDAFAVRNVKWGERGDVASHEVKGTDEESLEGQGSVRKLGRDW